MAGPEKLHVLTGTGLVIANMIGAGVFLSAGFMAQDLGPMTIMLAWVVGAVLALTGTLAYAGVIKVLPKSGGEYRFLSDLLHPWVGYMAGWSSILIGFAGPIAVDAIAAGCFLQTILPAVNPELVGVAVVLSITLLHTFDLSLSKWTLNWLVSIKVLLLIVFMVLGFIAGSHSLPDWSPIASSSTVPIAPFMASLFYIAFAFSGWNAAVYAAEEFDNPQRDVPRSMFIGCLAVALLYLLLNWIFVTNIHPDQASVVLSYDTAKITLGHILMSDLLGDAGGKVMSGFLVAAFISATSAMVFSGPRVYAAMAEDGYLPRMLRAKDGKPPVGSVLLQGAVATIIIFTQNLQNILHDIGAILTLFSALTAASLLWVRYRRRGSVTVSRITVVAAVVFIISAVFMFYYGIKANTNLLQWIVLIVIIASIAYFLSRRRFAATLPHSAGAPVMEMDGAKNTVDE